MKVSIKWFHENEMILNPDKFQAIIREKQKLKNTGVKFVLVQRKSKLYQLTCLA